MSTYLQLLLWKSGDGEETDEVGAQTRTKSEKSSKKDKSSKSKKDKVYITLSIFLFRWLMS